MKRVARHSIKHLIARAHVETRNFVNVIIARWQNRDVAETAEIDDGPLLVRMAEENPVSNRRDGRALPACGKIGLPQIAHNRALEAGCDRRWVHDLPRDRRLMKNRLAMHADHAD
jgi:hypothetical protein